VNYLRFQAMGILFASVFPLIVSGADGTWTPVVADRRVTEVRIDSNGDETLLRSHGGEFLRSTDGKQLTTEGKSQLDGSFDLSRATLLDFQQGAEWNCSTATSRSSNEMGHRGSRRVSPTK